jgi:hypothetical protein
MLKDEDWYPGWCSLWNTPLIAENELEDEMEEE